MDEGLIFEKLIVEDFGPFKGRQELLFPSNGVMLIYGNNGGGKTSIIRAINYAIYGELKERIKLVNLINLEAIDAGKLGFKIELFFSYNEDKYHFVREVKTKYYSFKPVDDTNLEKNAFVKENGKDLGPGQIEQVIERILPKEIARFFIFDGELLQEYRELLDDQSKARRTISESIETILGVPILVHTREDMKDLQRRAEVAVKDCVRKKKSHNNYIIALNEQTAFRDSYEKQLLELKEKLLDAESRKNEILDELRRNEAIQELVNKEELIKGKIKELNTFIERLETKSQEMMSEAWKEVLSYPIKMKLPLISEEKKKLLEEQGANLVYEFMSKSLTSDNCIICKRELNSDIRSQFIKTISEYSQTKSTISSRLLEMEKCENVLRTFENKDIIKSIIENEQELSAYRIDYQSCLDELKAVREEIGDQLDRSSLKELTSKFLIVSKQVENFSKGIADIQDKIDKLTITINNILDKLAKECVNEGEIRKETERRKLCDKLYQVFNKAVEEYKKYLKSKVENEATLIFKKMISEDSFEKLVINENYGLDVSLSNGDIVALPSEGQFHLVSLALIGALHHNAPLQGPIIMDSPIMRLDIDHRSNMIQRLPDLARQIVLLVTVSEMSGLDARISLSSKLTKEYNLKRYKGKTLHYTNIEEIRSTD